MTEVRCTLANPQGIIMVTKETGNQAPRGRVAYGQPPIRKCKGWSWTPGPGLIPSLRQPACNGP